MRQNEHTMLKTMSYAYENANEHKQCHKHNVNANTQKLANKQLHTERHTYIMAQHTMIQNILTHSQ